MDDSQIIALYFQRKEQAISATAIKFGSYCMSVAANILRDRRDAEEAVSDAWMDAWNTIPPTRPKSLRAFLATLTRRRALDRYDTLSAEKRGGGQVALALEELAECASPQDVQAQAEASELAERIGAFLRTIPSTYRRVFVCRYWYFDSIEVIAEQFGFSKSKVKSMLHRTRGKLRKYLEKEGIEV